MQLQKGHYLRLLTSRYEDNAFSLPNYWGFIRQTAKKIPVQYLGFQSKLNTRQGIKASS